MGKKNKTLTIGWREWVSLPGLQIKNIKVKVDSGAKTSAIHAENIDFLKIGSKEFVRFQVFPLQKDKKTCVEVTAPLVEKRWVKSSVGHKTLRPVIRTLMKIGEIESEIELTLINRDLMGFRMLLGREAFKDLFLLDASRSYIIGKKKVLVPAKRPHSNSQPRKKKKTSKKKVKRKS